MTPQRSSIVLVNNATTAGVPSILPVIRFNRWRAETLLTLTWKMYQLNALYNGLIKPALVTRCVYSRINTNSVAISIEMINNSAHFHRHSMQNTVKKNTFCQIHKQIFITYLCYVGYVNYDIRLSCYANLNTRVDCFNLSYLRHPSMKYSFN